MLIKVLCPCGTKFSFEVEPVHGRMPMRVPCPSCLADATNLANAAIAEQLAAPANPAAPPKVRMRTASASPPPTTPPLGPVATPGPTKLRMKHQTGPASDDAAASEAEAGGVYCSHHPAEQATEHCRVCGKPICPKCMETFGYVCSVFCRGKAEREKLEVPRYAKQRSVIEQAARTKARLVLAAVVAVLTLVCAGWIWWTFFGTKPRVIYSLKIPKAERGTTYEMLSPTELLAIKEKQLVLLDITKGAEVWSTALEGASGAPGLAAAPAPKPTKSAGPNAEMTAGKLATEAAGAATGQTGTEDEEEDWSFGSWGAPQLLTAEGDIWIKFPDRVAAYDRQTGARKQEIQLKQPLLSFTYNASSIVAVSGDPRLVRSVTLIALPTGTVKTEQIASPSEPARSARVAHPLANADSEELGAAPSRDDFLAAGPNVAQFSTKLLEHRTELQQAMKPKAEQSILDSGHLSAAQSLDATQELLNDMKRSDTGGTVREDVSRYQVTLRRRLGADVTPWTGEVIGPPSFFPLQTVDVLFGGKSLVVFDKANQKRWEAKLTPAA